ncbi:DNA cytosine methyltransferase [Leptospira barantonii]|uniref:DNA (cytosine-5-)-methyltransferase n=1 Tax=Leptospira barantonii TaxID=2023184 RepID=A0ABX4NKX7_9LEPT|nr:DNA cytosine methyltransferase [Leptospira barantonii]PJZ57459.1 hypothetical protein CH367_08880 [Leptospira barantonii]
MAKIIDLFCGVGGLSLGATRAGFELLYGMDKDEIALETHRKNFPNAKHILTDINLLSPNEFADRYVNRNVAGIIGGPPCQGFSVMGKRDVADPRNNLLTQFMKYVRAARPLFFMFENVPGLMHPRYNHIIKKSFDIVSNEYNIIGPVLLNAKEFGVPTDRMRIFCVGFLKGKSRKINENLVLAPPRGQKPISVSQAFKGLPIKINNANDQMEDWKIIKKNLNEPYSKFIYSKIPANVGDAESLKRFKLKNEVSGFIGTAHSEEVIKRWSKIKAGQRDSVSGCKRLDPKGQSPTIRAGTGPDKGSFQAVRPLHPSENRVITPREAARLQGFPDWFLFHSTKWHSFRHIGNSVSPIVAEEILSRIIKVI